MSYKGPIDIITSDMQSAVENEIYSAVKRVGVNVDKAELLKALAYDREQYQKGYEDRDKEIVRCKDCKYKNDFLNCIIVYEGWKPDDDWFCKGGERMET